ncbi:MAG: S8 family serine peptidase, partial [Tissierellia bacterium]|nr:S8 family serine peptidase [Tissierellia bacterium]
MTKKKQVRIVLSLLVCLVMVMGYFTPFVHAERNELSTVKEELRHVAQDKIVPEVKEDLEKDDFPEVLVYMKDQVDTEMVARATKAALSSSMTPYQTKLQVRRGVVEALSDKAETTQRNIIKYLEQEKEKGNVVEFKSYSVVNMLYVKATKEVIENLSYMTEVGKIYKNKTYTLSKPVMDNEIAPNSEGVEWNIARVGADQVWELGIDGTGVVVANIDSGVDWTHPALKEKWRGYDPATGATNPVANWFDPVYNSSLPADSDGHGTHVMGTMVGQEPDGSNKVGVAPGAQWIAARVFDAAGYTSDDILIEAADWILRPNGNPDNAPDVVNNSWGGPAGIDDWYRDAVTSWRSAEIFPVFSAGNQRPGEPLPWPGSISNPANYPESYAVAAVDKYDIRASFSKLGPSPYDETLVKPNISAPGVSIRSSIPGGGYQGGWSGTSMSAPAVSGTVALLLSANASLTPDEIEAILAETAEPLTDATYPESPNFGYGYGMVNAFEAVSQVAYGLGSISGRVLVEGEDTQGPVIEHEQVIFETFMGSDIEIVADISDDVSITEVELLVKAEGKSYWMVVPMNRISGDHKAGTYKGTITGDMLLGDSIVYKIKVRDFTGEAVVSQDYRIDIAFGIVPDEYFQGFETNANGWILDGSWEWGVPSNVGPEAYEGEGVVTTSLSGNYPNSVDDWLITPPIDLRDTSLEAASLRFYEWYDMENNYDKGYILVTNDYGMNWTEVRPVITGIGTEWKEAIVNLEDYIGSEDPIFVAFRFTSDFSGQRPGWYIDNVRLISMEYDPPSIPTGLVAEADFRGIKLDWDGVPEADLSHYNIYRSEEAGGEYIKIGETTATSFIDDDIVPYTTYYYVINAEDIVGNTSQNTEEVYATALEVVELFGTDFEEDDGGFVSGGANNPWEWGVPTSGPNAAYSGEKLWATNLSGNYPYSSDSYIVSPPIEIPEASNPVLTFNHW